MNSTVARYFALPLLSAGIIGGAALGLAGVASAAEPAPSPGPGFVAEPQTHAQPAPEVLPGYHSRHHNTFGHDGTTHHRHHRRG